MEANSREGRHTGLDVHASASKVRGEKKTHTYHISPPVFIAAKQSSKRVIKQWKICTDVGSSGGHVPLLISLK